MISLVCIACLVSGVALSLRTNALRQTKEIRIGLTPATLVADANRSLNVGILVIPVGTLAALDSDANTAYILNSVVVKYLKERAKLFLLGQDIQIESSLDSTHIMFAFQARHAMEQLFRIFFELMQKAEHLDLNAYSKMIMPWPDARSLAADENARIAAVHECWLHSLGVDQRFIPQKKAIQRLLNQFTSRLKLRNYVTTFYYPEKLHAFVFTRSIDWKMPVAQSMSAKNDFYRHYSTLSQKREISFQESEDRISKLICDKKYFNKRIDIKSGLEHVLIIEIPLLESINLASQSAAIAFLAQMLQRDDRSSILTRWRNQNLVIEANAYEQWVTASCRLFTVRLRLTKIGLDNWQDVLSQLTYFFIQISNDKFSAGYRLYQIYHEFIVGKLKNFWNKPATFAQAKQAACMLRFPHLRASLMNLDDFSLNKIVTYVHRLIRWWTVGKIRFTIISPDNQLLYTLNEPIFGQQFSWLSFEELTHSHLIPTQVSHAFSSEMLLIDFIDERTLFNESLPLFPIRSYLTINGTFCE